MSSGVVLAGGDRVEALRRRLDVDAVRASTAALNFVMTLSLLEDAQVMGPPARELMRRAAGETLLLSGINAHGRITYDVKHVCSRAAALAVRPGAPRVFAELDRVLFLDRLPLAEATGLLLDLAEDLHRSFRSGGCPELLAPMLEPFRPLWAWSGRAFT